MISSAPAPTDMKLIDYQFYPKLHLQAFFKPDGGVSYRLVRSPQYTAQMRECLLEDLTTIKT